MLSLHIMEVDPQGPDALRLLREAAVEARALYPELFEPDTPWPGNDPTPSGGAYMVAYIDGNAVACGALRPLADGAAEVRRMYVSRHARRQGVARSMMEALEHRAREAGYLWLRLETGHKQAPAIALYASMGFRRIAAFGPYVEDPTSVCFEKPLPAPEPRSDNGLDESA
jgi:ribosomal protein S18 acetylase RimI-like enzyme